MTHVDLYRKLRGEPFKPFRVKWVTGTTYDIVGPWMIVPGDSSAVVVTRIKRDEKGYVIADDWRKVSISHMVEFSDLNIKPDSR